MKIKDWRVGIGGIGAAHTGLFGRPTILREGEKDKGGGKKKEDDEDDEDEEPDPKLVKTVNKIMHSVLAERDKRSDKRVSKMITDAVTAAMNAGKKTDEDPADDDDEEDPEPEAKPAKGKSKKTGLTPEAEAMVNTAKKAAEDAKKIATEEKELRLKAERKSEADEERSKLTGMLTGRVRPEQLEDVVELLAKRVTRDPESKEILWKGDKWSDKEDADNSDNIHTIEEGIDKWASSPKGKSYAPARNLSGGGDRGAGSGGKMRKGDEPASDAEIGQLISNRMTHQR